MYLYELITYFTNNGSKSNLMKIPGKLCDFVTSELISVTEY